HWSLLERAASRPRLAAPRRASRKDRAPWVPGRPPGIIRNPAAGTAGAVPLGEEESMKSYPAEQIHNVVLISHGGAGKTSLAEALLYLSGAITRLGRVEDGNTTSDYDPDEIK